MGRRFEVGHWYEPYQSEYGSFQVERRTEKTIWVQKDGMRWSMRVRIDQNGNEYVVDPSVPPKWKDAYTYSAEWEVVTT